MDHIKPVVDPYREQGDWEGDALRVGAYVLGLFCPRDNLQLLCKPCHETKTALENEERRKA